MRYLKMSLAVAMFAMFGGLATAQEKKLSKDDFDMVKRVDKLEAEIVKLKAEVKELKAKGCDCKATATAATAKPVVTPVNSEYPASEGWQYDTVKKQYWRFTQTTTTTSNVTPATYYTQPAAQTTVKYYQIGGRYYAQPSCNGPNCPK
jgi:uncharacterized small protein (DUF1192 family)